MACTARWELPACLTILAVAKLQLAAIIQQLESFGCSVVGVQHRLLLVREYALRPLLLYLSILRFHFSRTGDLNDLWRYRFNDSTWTWMSGSNSTNAAGVSGTRGVASFSTRPAARADAAAWYEQATGQFRVFGGYRYSPNFGSFTDFRPIDLLALTLQRLGFQPFLRIFL